MSLVPQLGFGELVLLGVLALIVVGPKDLPKLMHAVGRFTAKVRRLGDEFRAGFDQMAREAELDELRREVDNLKRQNPMTEAKQALDDAAKDERRAK